MSIEKNLESVLKEIEGKNIKLVGVTKTKPNELIMEAYATGFKRFGENKVQELVEKQETLPKDIEWHMIGHLQRNKVKYMAGFVHLIHAVDSLKLLKEINKQALKQNRIIDCLIQLHIAKEETKFGFAYDEADTFFSSIELEELTNIRIKGLMGMATNTDNTTTVSNEFKTLRRYYESAQVYNEKNNIQLDELSMGMSSDYKIAIEEGTTMIRVGSAIFGERNYN